MSRHEQLAANLVAVEQRITKAAAAAGRDRTELTLVAISKTFPASDVALMRDLGVTDFGENRDAEAAGKAAAVPDVRWHFVGSVQTNKARSVASYADVVHSVDRAALVAALSAGAGGAARPGGRLLQGRPGGGPGGGGGGA